MRNGYLLHAYKIVALKRKKNPPKYNNSNPEDINVPTLNVISVFASKMSMCAMYLYDMSVVTMAKLAVATCLQAAMVRSIGAL